MRSAPGTRRSPCCTRHDAPAGSIRLIASALNHDALIMAITRPLGIGTAVSIVSLVTAAFVVAPDPVAAVDTDMTISTTAIDFGQVNVGSTAQASVTLTNTGGDPFGPINIFGGARRQPSSTPRRTARPRPSQPAARAWSTTRSRLARRGRSTTRRVSPSARPAARPTARTSASASPASVSTPTPRPRRRQRPRPRRPPRRRRSATTTRRRRRARPAKRPQQRRRRPTGGRDDPDDRRRRVDDDTTTSLVNRSPVRCSGRRGRRWW